MKQVSIYVENRPGRLAEVTKVLADAGVDIKALSIADTDAFGILRLIVNDPELAKRAVTGAGFPAKVTEVVAVAVEDHPGGLARVLAMLSREGVDVGYMYAFLGKEEGCADVILRVKDNAKAREILLSHGMKLID
mgnify:FL=1